ncbi:MAG: DNA-deoxyinosine glycosylase [Bacilli bacterium]|nr:DNA-deoxyinosine glycosylase [Bacilli bacterium]
MMKVKHELSPIYNEDSKVLILGSLPSVKSREEKFYYAHPKNRFWKTLSRVFNEEIGSTIEEKKAFLYKHHIALFDVIKSCEIKNSSDTSIKKVRPNNLNPILKQSKIKTIFTTGKKAYDLYQKYCYPKTKIEAIYLPSTSPANCPKNIESTLIDSYKQIKEKIDEKEE